MVRILMSGLALWAIGTIVLRLGGPNILRPNNTVSMLILYAVSFLLMAFLARRIFIRLGMAKENWAKAVSFLILPTLLLDPFSCAFFADVFPNLDPAAAGEFGGWMLICCGGAVSGVLSKR